MGLKFYSYINNSFKLNEPDKVVNQKVEKVAPITLDKDILNITLADKSALTSELIKVHKLSDYRRRSKSILLVPDVQVEIDRLLFDTEEVLKCIPIL